MRNIFPILVDCYDFGKFGYVELRDLTVDVGLVDADPVDVGALYQRHIGNKHIHISQNVMVESIMPGKGIRYTATVKADDRLRDGDAVIRIGVMQGNKDIPSQSREFAIKTSKR